MKKCFLFSYTKEVIISGNGKKKQNICVIFFPYKNVLGDQDDIKIQLREYFHHHTLPDRLIIICFEFNKSDINDLFEKESELYDFIPKFDYNQNEHSIHAISINSSGNYDHIIGEPLLDTEIKEIYNRGMVKIFNDNGGLIISQSAHHFVFPSGKHCDKFLRPGNVLIHGAQISFIASSLINHFGNKKVEYIYCDTSSINSLAYAYINLRKELDPSITYSHHVESFGSYELFEKSESITKGNSIHLISASTSGSILDRLTDSAKWKRNIQRNDIAIIYGLNVVPNYSDRVICDLTINPTDNPFGLEEFISYNVKRKEKCALCENGSKAIKVEGDVFLLEKPVVTGHIIKSGDAPSFLKNFGAFYKKRADQDESTIRTYFKENGAEKKYEVYLDISSILNGWDERDNDDHPFASLNKKLEKYIIQNIPASLKYMIVLPDEASKKLAEIISKVLNTYGVNFSSNNIIGIQPNDLNKIDPDKKGAIGIISSSIVTGSNLLYLSRALRNFDSYQRIFFTYMSRTSNNEHFKFLQSNLGHGEFGIASHKIFNVETIYCSQEAQYTPWHYEEEFIKSLEELLEENDEYLYTIAFCKKRIKELAESGKSKGLSNNLFFTSLQGDALALRKGFAFSPYQSVTKSTQFTKNSTQSEIYFIISCILNELRNNNTLSQSEYVRNLIDPGNFVRYNDGIIQASLLRAATNGELNYSLSEDMGLQMKSILGDMISHIQDNHAEAINEFFYAIAIKKMKLTNDILKDCVDLLESQEYYINNDSILKALVYYIKENIIIQEPIADRFPKTAPFSV
jgi:hypothetical protein